MRKKKMLNEGNQIHNVILCLCELLAFVIPFYYGSGSGTGTVTHI
jgi:hypothetical protein